MEWVSSRRWPSACLLLLVASLAQAKDKAEIVRNGASQASARDETFARPDLNGSSGTRFDLTSGAAQVPVAVVRGTPYQMGWQLGQLMQKEMHAFIPRALAGVSAELKVSPDMLAEVWARSAAFGDDRVEQELAGLADGSGMPL